MPNAPHRSPHPGRSIRRDCLEALGLTVTDSAKILGITRHMPSRILNGQAGISPEMAVRLEKAFGGNRAELAGTSAGVRSRTGRTGENQSAPGVFDSGRREGVREAIQKGRPVGRPPNVANSRLLILAKTAYSHVLTHSLEYTGISIKSTQNRRDFLRW
ncbi:MAG: HigA family addiction module antitoxin [Nitrospira sp.]|nr:HigA family addiction module antitoxin [Nitrospira sp.]